MGDGIECFVNGWDLCHPHPFLGQRLFRHRLFSAATASALCNYMVCSTIYYIPHPAPSDSGKPDDPDHAGALLVAMPITMALVVLLSGWLSDRIGSRLPTYDRALRVVSTVAVVGALASLVRGRRSST